MRFAVIINGVVDHVLDAPSGFSLAGQTLVACADSVSRGDLYDGSAFTTPIPTVVTKTLFYPYDFLNLFTSTEMASILSSSDLTVKIAIAKMLSIVTYVDLNDPTTKTLTDYLVSVNLLTADRAAAVLAGTPPG